jgi:hypothetical protein
VTYEKKMMDAVAKLLTDKQVLQSPVYTPIRAMRKIGPNGMPLDGHVGMTLETIREGDYAAFGRVCPQCRETFHAGDSVLESLDQQVQIHVDCVRAMQRLLPDDPQFVEDLYERNRTELTGEFSDG